MRSALAPLAVVAALIATPALAQDASLYRPGLPAVMGAPAAATPYDADGFREAYRRAGSPRVLVFWMRALSDAVTAPQVDVEVRRGSGALGAVASRTTLAAVGGWSETTGRISGEVTEGPDDPLGAVDSAGIHAGFSNALLSQGVRLIDRSAAMRLSGESGQRAAETAALAEKADLLIEVTAPAGVTAADATWRISAKDTGSGALLVDTVVTPEDMEDLMVDSASYEADPQGGYRRISKPDAVGRALAEHLMGRLTASTMGR